MAFDKKLFLDYEGLAAYDELIKQYIQTSAVDSTNVALEQLAELGEVVAQNTDAIAVLNGEGEGSVKKAVEDAVNGIVDGAPEALDTLKELADWIESDETASAALIARVGANEDAIAQLQADDEELKVYVDTQDKAVYDSIQSIANLKIMSLFAEQQKADVDAAAAINALAANGAIVLQPEQTVAEDIAITKPCYIDANGSTFTGTVTVPAGVEVIIENAVFANPVVVA